MAWRLDPAPSPKMQWMPALPHQARRGTADPLKCGIGAASPFPYPRTMSPTTAETTVRDDLFTHIHKGLSFGLFDLAVRTGRTDWSDEAEVKDLVDRWSALVSLLRVHTSHEDRYIFRLLDSPDP